jgi:hypothetical protein
MISENCQTSSRGLTTAASLLGLRNQLHEKSRAPKAEFSWIFDKSGNEFLDRRTG